MSVFQNNLWIKFLRQYGAIPCNDNMYDETIQRLARRAKTEPLRFETPHLERILASLQENPGRNVILTGTAGDGKTYLCREVFERLGGDFKSWDRDEKVAVTKLPSGRDLVILKDMSKLNANDPPYLVELAETLFAGTAGRQFLVAANDGILMEGWYRAGSTEQIQQTREAVEDALVNGREECNSLPLVLFNLSRTKSSELLPKVMDAVLNHEGWQGCENCAANTEDPTLRCPIIENASRLGSPLLQERLISLMKTCDHNGYHLPIRQLLILVSNALLGHQAAKEHVMSCADIPNLVESGMRSGASIYRNIFGANLRRRSYAVFETLRGLGIGDETNNSVENILTFGHDDPSLRPIFEKLMLADGIYGANAEFLELQDAYLSGEDPVAEREFLEHLVSQRQRLFFTIEMADTKTLRPWDLTVFQFGGEYLDEVLPALERGARPPKRVVERLTCGLNRVFTGMLTRTTRELWIATSGDHSQARVSRIAEGAVSLEPDRGQCIMLRLVEGRLTLSVYLDRDIPVDLPLNLIRYEFLSRVAEGALPSSFSRECYEDMLSFKTRLLARYRELHQDDEESHDPSEIVLRLLELDPRGKLVDQSISITLGGVA